ncbi:hypothetical protein JD844_006122 [Phrynosoma platyrhinos]|uniref:DH domain-containing protein n=1 Tax=Phrynosoma platyrhinos TaxID=52577 RepID=A0ABQ7TQK8_PHRPL|nr:hypothetical protein JD844_006122 [Phrynosoma platyrhinos]
MGLSGMLTISFSPLLSPPLHVLTSASPCTLVPKPAIVLPRGLRGRGPFNPTVPTWLLLPRRLPPSLFVIGLWPFHGSVPPSASRLVETDVLPLPSPFGLCGFLCPCAMASSTLSAVRRPTVPPFARLTGKLGRSESLRVCERKRSQRGSAKGKQPRSRSDVDIEAAARASELEEKPALDQARQKQGSRNLVFGHTELFITEHAHVRMLRVLLEVFYQPLLTEGFFIERDLANIFPSLEDLVDEHKEDEERQKVERAAECCRQILNHKLKDYQRRLDLSNLKQSTDPLLSEFRNTDITKKNLVCEGPLTWRLTKDKSIDVHVLLLDDILVLLQKQEDRLVLKCHSRTITPTPDGKQMLSPIIKLNSAMIREVATDIKAFYVIFSWENGAQIYELVAQTVSERKNWCSMISETAGSLKLPRSNHPKPRLSVPNRTSPPSPSYYSEGLLGGTENGSSLKEALQSEEREKDGMLEGAEFEERSPVGEPKLGKAMEEFLADILTLYKPRPGGQGVLAAAAQDRVSALKRLLQISEEGDGAFPAEQMEGPPENGTPQPGQEEEEEEEEWDGGHATEMEGRSSERRHREGTLNGPQEPPWASEHQDKDSHLSPLILSHQQTDGVKHHLRLLEDAIQGLKDIEADYWRLQQLMGKLTSSQQSSFT